MAYKDTIVAFLDDICFFMSELFQEPQMLFFPLGIEHAASSAEGMWAFVKHPSTKDGKSLSLASFRQARPRGIVYLCRRKTQSHSFITSAFFLTQI